jgi:[ribosomal protein S5]-alanine N-acetyltransferase
MTVNKRLETERLHLRGLSSTDRRFIHALISDEDVRRFLGGPVPAERRDGVVSGYFITDVREAVWLAETKETSLPVGLVFISNHKDGMDSELSYQFTRDVWGMGYAIEATRRVLDYALNDLGLVRLIAETQSANKPSCRLLDRLGMTELGRVMRFGAEQIIYASR